MQCTHIIRVFMVYFEQYYVMIMCSSVPRKHSAGACLATILTSYTEPRLPSDESLPSLAIAEELSNTTGSPRRAFDGRRSRNDLSKWCYVGGWLHS